MIYYPPYNPLPLLQNGMAMTIYTSVWGGHNWEKTNSDPEPPYEERVFSGAQEVPIFGWVAIPENPRATIIATYGITGSVDNQWYLKLLGRKAFAQGYAVVLFDWRAHGKTAELSPALTSDGLYEGEDFVRIAEQVKSMGCPRKFWFVGYSLGGQLALWAVKAAQESDKSLESDIGGAAVVCPSLDSVRSLAYLVKHPVGKYIEAGIARNLKQLAWQIHDTHPGSLDPKAIERANSIWGFDQELVIGRLGFPAVEDYYNATSGLPLLPNLRKPTLIIYAADDPFFDPAIIPELQALCAQNSAIDLLLTPHGGHVGYISSKKGQRQAEDPDIWWAWNRVLQWVGEGERERIIKLTTTIPHPAPSTQHPALPNTANT